MFALAFAAMVGGAAAFALLLPLDARIAVAVAPVGSAVLVALVAAWLKIRRAPPARQGGSALTTDVAPASERSVGVELYGAVPKVDERPDRDTGRAHRLNEAGGLDS